MEFQVTLEGIEKIDFRVVVKFDEYGPEIDKIYAPDSKVDISYFMDSWFGEILNDVLKQLEESKRVSREEI